MPVEACLDGSEPPSALVSTYNAGDADISLRCGTPDTTGVLHIDKDHPVEPEDAAAFLTCVFNVFERGSFSPALANRSDLVGFDFELSWGRRAIGVYDRVTTTSSPSTPRV